MKFFLLSFLWFLQCSGSHGLNSQSSAGAESPQISALDHRESNRTGTTNVDLLPDANSNLTFLENFLEHVRNKTLPDADLIPDYVLTEIEEFSLSPDVTNNKFL